MSSPVLIASFQLVPSSYGFMFQSFYILGSNDGIAWTYLASNTNTVLWVNGVPQSFTTTTTVSYSYYRLVVTQASTPFSLGGFILYGSNGPILSTVSAYTITGANNHILQSNGTTVATLTWSWSNTYTQSTTQSVARIMTSNGYASSTAYLGCTNAAEYPVANNGYATTSAPSTTYTYIVPAS